MTDALAMLPLRLEAGCRRRRGSMGDVEVGEGQAPVTLTRASPFAYPAREVPVLRRRRGEVSSMQILLLFFSQERSLSAGSVLDKNSAAHVASLGLPMLGTGHPLPNNQARAG